MFETVKNILIYVVYISMLRGELGWKKIEHDESVKCKMWIKK